MTHAPRWSAVVVNYEAGDALLGCVETLLADTSAGPVEVIVVDNGSTDGSVQRLERAIPHISVIVTGKNLGYAGAANRGIAASTAPVVAVCNPDLTVAPGTAGALVGRLDTDEGLGAVGPAISEPDGSNYPSARQVPRLRDAVGHGVLGLVRPIRIAYGPHFLTGRWRIVVEVRHTLNHAINIVGCALIRPIQRTVSALRGTPGRASMGHLRTGSSRYTETARARQPMVSPMP